jgi:hypothetical protein
MDLSKSVRILEGIHRQRSVAGASGTTHPVSSSNKASLVQMAGQHLPCGLTLLLPYASSHQGSIRKHSNQTCWVLPSET